MSTKFIAIFSGLFLMMCAPTHLALADFASPSIAEEDDIEAFQSQRAMAPLFEDYRAIPQLIERLETPKMIMSTFFGEMSVKDQLTEFLDQDPVSQISTVFDLGKSLYNDVQLLKFAHRIVFSPTENEPSPSLMVQKELKSQSLLEKIEENLAKIGPRSIFDFQMVE
jgi:hypothetical protein